MGIGASVSELYVIAQNFLFLSDYRICIYCTLGLIDDTARSNRSHAGGCGCGRVWAGVGVSVGVGG